jgi:hypothetical protein
MAFLLSYVQLALGFDVIRKPGNRVSPSLEMGSRRASHWHHGAGQEGPPAPKPEAIAAHCQASMVTRCKKLYGEIGLGANT